MSELLNKNEILNEALELSKKMEKLEQDLKDFVDFVEHLEKKAYLVAHEVKEHMLYNMRSQLSFVEQGFDKEKAKEYLKGINDCLLNESQFKKIFTTLSDPKISQNFNSYIKTKKQQYNNVIKLSQRVGLTYDNIQKAINSFSKDITREAYNNMYKSFNSEEQKILLKIKGKKRNKTTNELINNKI